MSDLVLYETRGAVALITLNRAEVHNAQNPQLLDELDACWTRAEEDNAVKVILLKANGKNFSSGHDVASGKAGKELIEHFDYEKSGLLGQYLWEGKKYFGYCQKWRNNPKPSIAAVQGACVGAGLMLCWPCDLIICADNAWFSDPTIIMGIGGIEYHGHTWELGHRKAKQLLFTADRFNAEQAQQLGMVNEIVPLDELEEFSLQLAERISRQNMFSLIMAKRAVNQTMDIMGHTAALQTAFDLHEFQHAQCLATSGGRSSVITHDVKELRKKNTEQGD